MITSYFFLLFICTWILTYSKLKCRVWWTWFLIYFNLNFTGYSRQKKSNSNREKIQFIKLYISNKRLTEKKTGFHTRKPKRMQMPNLKNFRVDRAIYSFQIPVMKNFRKYLRKEQLLRYRINQWHFCPIFSL